MAHKPEVIAIIGQTATGKSDLAIELAQLISGEIINADAMQLYRGMDIGTAKVSPADRQLVRHHLLDVLAVTEEASVAAYQNAARLAISQIFGRGNTPIVVGGSGLYVRAALDEMKFPPTDPQLRAGLYERVESEGLEALFAELEHRDPAAAATIEPRNDRRIVRALEVIELTGKPFAASLPSAKYVRPTRQFALTLSDADLDERISQRVAVMWDAGLADEVRALSLLGLVNGPTAPRAVGYAETLRYLDGEWSQDQTLERIALSTRQLARRQRRWFSRDSRIEYVQAGTPAAELFSRG